MTRFFKFLVNKALRFEFWNILILVLVSGMVTWPCVLGIKPTSRDHLVHFSKIQYLERSLSQGLGLYSWSHHWFAGYPTDMNYPFLGYLPVIALNKLSFNLISLDSSYALTLFGLFLFYSWSIYFLTRQFTSSNSAVFAGVISLLDAGSFLFGGYKWEMFWGVWPCKLACAMAALSVALALKAKKSCELGQFILLGIVFGFGICIHPIFILFLPVLIGVLIFYELINIICLKMKASWRDYPFFALSLLIGICVSLFWLTPFLATTRISSNLGLPWIGIRTLAWNSIHGNLLPGVGTTNNYFILIGVFCVFIFGNRKEKFLALLPTVILLLATNRLSELTFGLLLPSFKKNIEFTRFVMLAKPFFFSIAGVLLGLIYGRISLTLRNSILSRILTGTFLAVFLAVTLSPILHLRKDPRWTVSFQDRDPVEHQVDSLKNWLCEKKLQETGFFRVSFDIKNFKLQFIPLKLTYDCDIPMLLRFPIPASGLRYQFCEYSLSDALRLGSKYFVTDTERNHSDLVPLGKIGKLFLYRLPQSPNSPFTIQSGTAKFRILKWNPSVVEFQVTEASGETVEVPLLDIGFWKAHIDNISIPTLNPAPDDGAENTMYLVKLPLRNGTYRLDYRIPTFIWVGTLFGFFSLAVAIAAFIYAQKSAKKCQCQKVPVDFQA